MIRILGWENPKLKKANLLRARRIPSLAALEALLVSDKAAALVLRPSFAGFTGNGVRVLVEPLFDLNVSLRAVFPADFARTIAIRSKFGRGEAVTKVTRKWGEDRKGGFFKCR
jgi:hypothetical protein